MTTISQEYLETQQDLHQNPNYGVASLSYAGLVASFMQFTGAKTVSDYGAGKCRLLEGLRQHGITPLAYHPYDPVFPEYGDPQPADLVCCIDVLEHIEPEYIDAVIQQLADVTIKHGFFTINTGPAKKSLPDGRNAHLIQRSTSWWLDKLIPHFEILRLECANLVGPDLWLIVSPRKESVDA